MITNPFTRRDFSIRLASLLSGLGLGGSAFGLSGLVRVARVSGSDDVSHACEAIHQEVTFKVERKRVYEALTDAKQFNKVVQLSAAGMSLGNVPTEISREVGGTFSLFGGHILGRHVELVPNERLVQAWRVANWNPGVYSIAKFALTEQGTATKLIFDHTGFPDGQGQHLAEGWWANYWSPLEKYFTA
jgi:activator of HSP90 ATPase